MSDAIDKLTAVFDGTRAVLREHFGDIETFAGAADLFKQVSAEITNAPPEQDSMESTLQFMKLLTAKVALSKAVGAMGLVIAALDVPAQKMKDNDA